MIGTSKKVEKINRCFFFFSIKTLFAVYLKYYCIAGRVNFENGCNARLMKKGCIKVFAQSSIIDVFLINFSVRRYRISDSAIV